MFQTIIQYGIISFFLYLLKYILKQNEMIESTLKKLTEKTLEQEITFDELKEAYHKLEDITILKERNKLAKEIHDTLGHTLTTVLMETEAGKILIGKDKEQGIKKIELAQEQVRKGLDDLRSSVMLLSKGEELVDLKVSLEHFIQETIKHTGVTIRYDINLKDQLSSSIRKTLFRAFQEGITNGIKHGKSTAFVFQLDKKMEHIEFLLQDNGKGCFAVVQGFGLKTMQERVKEISGTMRIESEPEEGFSLSISIPIIEGAI
jgi:signal transduction histidine kinase